MRAAALGFAAGLLLWAGAFLLAMAIFSLAHAHGDAQWIADGGYKDAQGTTCCGPEDCKVVGAGEIRRVAGGWLHVPTQTTLADGDPGIHNSIDAQMWRCVWGGRLHCLFTGAGM